VQSARPERATSSAPREISSWSRARDSSAWAWFLDTPRTEAISATSSSYHDLYAVGGQVFALYDEPPKQQAMIAVLTNAADPSLARVVVDPNAMNPQGTTAIDWFVPSPDGKWVAVSLSDNGSEDGTLHVFDVMSGKEVGEPIAPSRPETLQRDTERPKRHDKH